MAEYKRDSIVPDDWTKETFPETQDDIIKYIAFELGYDEKLVHKVVSNYWKGLRFYLSNPYFAQNGILLSKFLRFYLREDKVTEMAKSLKTKPERYINYGDMYILEFNELINPGSAEWYLDRVDEEE